MNKCHCGQPPIDGLPDCYTCLHEWLVKSNNRDGCIGKGMLLNSVEEQEGFKMHDANTPEGRLQRTAVRILRSILIYSGKDGCMYASNLLTDPMKAMRGN